MRKKLTNIGNSSALVLDKTLMGLLNLNKDSEVELSVNGRRLTITSVDEETRAEKMAAALEKINQQHGESLKRLAN